VIGLANKNVILEQDETGRLSKETRKDLATRVQERLDAHVPYKGKNQPLHLAMQMQARHLAAYLRGEYPAYEPFVLTW
jgi:CRISPR/Cas system-associated endonuclease Cas1